MRPNLINRLKEEWNNLDPVDPLRGLIADAIDALVEQPAQQEPVAAECKFDREEKWVRCEIAHHNLVQSEPEKWPGYQTRLLYTSPPAQRKPLTDEQKELLAWLRSEAEKDDYFGNKYRGSKLDAAADMIEAAHGIKEQP